MWTSHPALSVLVTVLAVLGTREFGRNVGPVCRVIWHVSTGVRNALAAFIRQKLPPVVDPEPSLPCSEGVWCRFVACDPIPPANQPSLADSDTETSGSESSGSETSGSDGGSGEDVGSVTARGTALVSEKEEEDGGSVAGGTSPVSEEEEDGGSVAEGGDKHPADRIEGWVLVEHPGAGQVRVLPCRAPLSPDAAAGPGVIAAWVGARCVYDALRRLQGNDVRVAVRDLKRLLGVYTDEDMVVVTADVEQVTLKDTNVVDLYDLSTPGGGDGDGRP